MIDSTLAQSQKQGQITGLADDIKAVADLRRQMLRYEHDRQLEYDGGHVFYAVDTDILYMHLIPDDTARYAYSRVFPYDPDEQTEFLSGVLSSFIFNLLPSVGPARPEQGPLNRWRPLLLLPGHDGEVRRFYDRVISTVAQGVAQGVEADRTLRTFVSQVEEARSKKDLQELLGRSPVEALFQVAEPAAQARLLKRLVAQNSLQSLEQAGFNPAFAKLAESLKGKLSDLRAPRSVKQMVDLAALNRSWLDVLSRAKTGRSAGVSNDAKALARLEQINRDLKGSTPPIRLALITGAPTIHTAAESRDADTADATFADLYIRTPLSFLGAEEVIKPKLDRPGSFESGHDVASISDEIDHKWVDVYLGEFIEENEPDFASLARLASDEAVGDRVRTATRIINNDAQARLSRWTRWKDHVEHLRSAHGSVSSIALTELRARIGQRADFTHASVHKLSELLAEEIEDSWDALYEIALMLGSDFLLNRDPETPFHRRAVPPVVLQGFPELQRFVDLASKRTLHHYIDPTMLEALFGTGCRTVTDLIRHINEREPSGYLSALVMALLFAYADRTYTASTVAERAIEIHLKHTSRGEGRDFETVPVTGREAFYLYAGLLRSLAEDESELTQAQDALEQFNESQGLTPGYEFTGLRYESEKALIMLRRICVRMWADEAHRIKAQEALGDLPELITRLKEVTQAADLCGHETVRSTVKRRLAAAGISALAIAVEHGVEADRHSNALADWRRILDEAAAEEKPDGRSGRYDLSLLTLCAVKRSTGSFGAWDTHRLKPRPTTVARELLQAEAKREGNSIDRKLYEMLLR